MLYSSKNKQIKPCPPLALLLKHFILDPTCVTGLRWKKPTAVCMKFGDVAGGIGVDGYTRVKFFGKDYKTARLILVLTTGHDHPHLEADHIDRNPLNNHPDNLRWVDSSAQQKNRKEFIRYPRKPNKSGHKNIYYHKKSRTYHASVTRRGKTLTGPERANPDQALLDLQEIFNVFQKER